MQIWKSLHFSLVNLQYATVLSDTPPYPKKGKEMHAKTENNRI